MKFHFLAAANMKMTFFFDVTPAIAMKMEAASTSETSTSFYETTRRKIPS
jgi:hypothetical protein